MSEMEKFTPLAKNFTLPPAVTAGTNLTSALHLAHCTLYIIHFNPLAPSPFPRCTTDKLVPDVVPPQKKKREEKNMSPCFQNSSAFPTLLIFRFSQNCLASGLFTNLNILRGNN